MLKSDVIDPTKVTRSALDNASSVAGLLLMTDVLVTEKPEEDKTAAPTMLPGCMGGMY